MGRSFKVLKNTLWEMGYYLIVILLGFLAPRFIILVYGSEVNGLSSTITQILNILLLLQSGATSATVYSLYKPIAENNHKAICDNLSIAEKSFRRIAVVFLGIMTIASVASTFLINTSLKKRDICIAFLLMGLKSFFDLYYTSKFRIIFTAYQEKYIISISTLIEQIVYYCLVFISIYLNIHYIFMYVWFTLGCVIKIICLLIFYKKLHNNIHTNIRNLNKGRIGNRNYALANEVSHSIVASSPMIILSFLYGLMEVSVYSVYALVNSAIVLFTTALYSAFAPSFGNLYAHDNKEASAKVFRIFQFVFNIFNTFMMMCMMTLILPFVYIYTKGADDIQYINVILAVLLSFNGLVFTYRIPYNVIVSSCGFFKETWKQPVISAVISILLSVVLGVVNYAYILVGPIVFYLGNYFYQYFKLNSLVPYMITKDTFIMFGISIIGFILSYLTTVSLSYECTAISFIVRAIITVIICALYMLVMSGLFLRKNISETLNYANRLIGRKKI